MREALYLLGQCFEEDIMTLPPFSDLLQQTGGVSVGSLLLPMVTYFCMEGFNEKALY
jgi:hypothetical protein